MADSVRAGTPPERARAPEPASTGAPAPAAGVQFARTRRAGPASPIARERVLSHGPSAGFVVATVVLAFLVVAVSFAVAVIPVERTSAESDAPLIPTGIRSARAVSALLAGALVASTALVGRRLLHSEGVGVVAAALVAVDPLVLGHGRIALPHSVAMGAAMLAFALFLSSRPNVHWVASAALFIAAFAEARVLLWCIPLGVLVLMRGHIYAAPRHLGWTLVQVAGLPAVGAVLGLIWVGDYSAGPACLSMPLWDALSLRRLAAPDPMLLLVPGPVTWFGGIAALVALAGTALVTVLMNFRIARLPGRIQLRLVEDLPAGRARILWIAGLAVLTPFPALWLPLFALALAAGIRELSQDAPGFGIVLSAAAVIVGLAVLVRLWAFVQGSAGPEDLARLEGLVPWARVVAC